MPTMNDTRDPEGASIAISIVIAARNMAAYLAATLQSALDGVTPTREVIVVDDGSTDGTGQIAQAFAARDPRITVLTRRGGEGVSVARNAGLARARGASVLFLDADDLLTTDALTRLHDALTDAPNAPASFGDLVPMAEDGTVPDHAASAIDIKPRRETLAALVAKNFIVNGGVLLIQRTALDRVGGFTPGIAYGEDWELWCRLATEGDFAVVDGAPVLYWRQRAAGANHTQRGSPKDKSVAALDAVLTNPVIASQLGADRLKRLSRQRRIDLYWASARQELMFGSKARFLALAARGALRYPDSVLRPKLVLRFLGSLGKLGRLDKSSNVQRRGP